MNIQVVRIMRPLDLGDYDEAFRGQVLHVWVNPSGEVRQQRQDLIQEYGRFLKSVAANSKPQGKLRQYFARLLLRKQVDGVEALAEKNKAWLAVILNQNEAEPCTVDELSRLLDTDLVLYEWVLRRAVEMIESHQAEKKSPLRMPLNGSPANT